MNILIVGDIHGNLEAFNKVLEDVEGCGGFQQFWCLGDIVVKMGGSLVRHARRLVFQLAEVAVFREVFSGVLERIGRFCPVAG